MTEMEQYQGNTTMALADVQDRAVARLTEWAQSAQAAHTIAKALVETSFVPAAFKGKPGEATAAILAGLEVGLSPMAALRSFDIIQGQAAARAVTLRAIVQSQGHEVHVIESSETRAVVAGKRKGSSNEQRSTWTLDRAKRLGLDQKDNWKKQPGAMLIARATSEVCRLIASDAILGLPYSAEEIADGGPDDRPLTLAHSAPEAGKKRVSRRASESAPEATAFVADEPTETDPTLPPLPGEIDDEENADGIPDDERLITPKQMKALHASLGEIGLGGAENRDAGVDLMSRVIARNIESSKELTCAEASTILDAIKTGDYESAS